MTRRTWTRAWERAGNVVTFAALRHRVLFPVRLWWAIIDRAAFSFWWWFGLENEIGRFGWYQALERRWIAGYVRVYSWALRIIAENIGE